MSDLTEVVKLVADIVEAKTTFDKAENYKSSGCEGCDIEKYSLEEYDGWSENQSNPTMDAVCFENCTEIAKDKHTCK